MKTTTQISLVLGAMLVFGFIKYRGSERKSQNHREHSIVERESSVQPIVPIAQVRPMPQSVAVYKKPLKYTQKQKSIAGVPNTRRNVPSSLPANTNVDIDRDLGLDNKVIDDLSFLLSIEKRERDFLLHEVRVTPEKYQKIQQQRKIVRWQLKEIGRTPAAQGMTQQQAKNAILAKHVYWMQSEIGVGYYNRLQEISLGAR
jgi:hypothetical protein